MSVVWCICNVFLMVAFGFLPCFFWVFIWGVGCKGCVFYFNFFVVCGFCLVFCVVFHILWFLIIFWLFVMDFL